MGPQPHGDAARRYRCGELDLETHYCGPDRGLLRSPRSLCSADGRSRRPRVDAEPHPAADGRASARHPPAARGLLIGLMVLNAAAIVATFSRTGFVTLLVSLALSLRALPRKRAWKWVAAALVQALVAVPLWPSGYVDRLATIAHVAGDPTGSSQERARDMQIAMEFALSHPLVGAGLGNNILVLNQLRGPMWQPVHNVYLEYAVDLGWPGLALFILLLGGCLRHAGRIARRSGGDPALHELSALAGGIWI